MVTEVKAAVTLAPGGKIILSGKGHTDHTVQIDYLPPFDTDDGFMPLELLLVSLAACSCHTVLLLLRRAGRSVEAMEVRAAGQRRDEHPTVFTAISLAFTLKGAGLDRAAVEQAIRTSEAKICPVWAMLKNSVAVTWTCTVD